MIDRVQRTLVLAAVACALGGSAPALLAQPVTGTETPITFAYQLEEQAREQLRRLLARYDLDPWMFTDVIDIDAGDEPHSMPVLTLNGDFLDDDLMQLAVFLHEQAHWFVYEHDEDARDAAIEELRRLYPEPPDDGYRTYQHLLVAWLELDAMVELVGEQEARRVLEAKVEKLTAPPVSDVDVVYRWYNERVLEDTAAIGAIAAKHGLVVTPGSGLVVEAEAARAEEER